MEMSYISLGENSHITVRYDLTRRSPLVTFVLFLNDTTSYKLQSLARILLWSAPITISTGCRLILSIREVVSSQYLTSISSCTSCTMCEFVVQDGSWRGEDSRIA